MEFEWVVAWPEFAVHMHEHLPKNAAVLEVGCGNSGLVREMRKSGFVGDLTVTDISTNVRAALPCLPPDDAPSSALSKMQHAASAACNPIQQTTTPSNARRVKVVRTLQRKFGQLEPPVRFEVADATNLAYGRCSCVGATAHTMVHV